MPDTTPDTSTSSSSMPVPSDSDLAALSEMLESLTPAQRDKLKRMTKTVPGLKPESDALRTLPDGSIECRITLSPDVVGMLQPWAESAGLTMLEQIQQTAETAIVAYLNMDWQAMATPPAPAAPTAPAVPAVVPPAVPSAVK